MAQIIIDEPYLQSASRYLQQHDRVMAKLIETHGSCTMRPWAAEPFNSIVNAIISQQLSTKAADTIIARALTIAGYRQRFTAKRLLAASEEQLRACGLSGAKVRYVQGVARAVQDRQIDLQALYAQSEQECVDTLIELKGVGRWTVEMLLIFVYGHSDILSLGDWGLRRGAQYAYQLDDPPNDKVFTGMADIWRPYRSVASWYLWRSAESGPLQP